MLVFCVRIEVVGSLWWLMQDIGLGFAGSGPLPGQGPKGPGPMGPKALGPVSYTHLTLPTTPYV